MAYLNQFINSKDIRKFYNEHSELEISNSSPWLLLRLVIESIDTTLEQKIEALKELSVFNDEKYKILSYDGDDFLFGERLTQIIDLLEEEKEDFFNDNDIAYYNYHFDGLMCDGDGEGYATYEDVRKRIEYVINEYLEEGENPYVWIDKIYLKPNSKAISALYSEPEHKLITIHDPWNYEFQDVKEAQTLILAHPFKRGDVLIYKDQDDSRNNKVFVLDHIEDTENSDAGLIKYTREIQRPLVWGYFLDEGNNIIYDALWCNSNENLEYYEEGLHYYEKNLGIISRIIRGTSMEAEGLFLAKDAYIETDLANRENNKKLRLETSKSCNPRYKVYLDASYARYRKSISMEREREEVKMNIDLKTELDRLIAISDEIKKNAVLKRDLPLSKIYPKVVNQKERLRELCETGLSKIEHVQLEQAKDRLEWELSAIENTETEFMFLYFVDLMKELQIKACDISGRGTWTSSLVAYLIGISEINPIKYNLSPEFIYGLDGGKEIDIDVNFADTKYRKRCDVCRQLDGVADAVIAGNLKPWYHRDIEQFIKKFEKDHNLEISEEDKQQAKDILEGQVKGYSHYSGKIILIPEGYNIEDYSNVYRNSDGEKVTKLDYFELDNTFCQLDLLFHNVIDNLQELSHITNVDLETIPLDDPTVYELFTFKDGVSDSYDLPEFGSDFVQEILKKSKATTFNQLVKVDALSHGTGGWMENADELIENETATIDDVIATREDIFDYCLSLGLDRTLSFKITEAVRKGLIHSGKCQHWEAWRDIMLNAGAKEWYVDSCEKIMYLFSRSQAISYMMMVIRMGWFKVYYPDSYQRVTSEEK